MKGEGGGAMKGLSETRAAEPGVRSTCVRCSWKRGWVRPVAQDLTDEWQEPVAQDLTEAGGRAPVPWLIAPRSERRNSGRLCEASCVYSRVFLSLRQLRSCQMGSWVLGSGLRRRALGWESSNVGNWSNVCGWDGLEWEEGSGWQGCDTQWESRLGLQRGQRRAKLLYKWNLLNFSFNN